MLVKLKPVDDDAAAAAAAAAAKIGGDQDGLVTRGGLA
jgi:hypothetical protein